MTFDLICAALALGFAAWGFFRGLLRQIFGIIGFIGGLLLARMFAGDLAEMWHLELGLPVAVTAAIFGVVLFVLAEIAAKVLGGFLTNSLGSFTGMLNRLGGLGLGAVKGLLLVWVLASLAALAQPHLRNAARKSPLLAKLELDKSQAVAIARDTGLLGKKAKELRARAEQELRARK